MRPLTNFIKNVIIYETPSISIGTIARVEIKY